MSREDSAQLDELGLEPDTVVDALCRRSNSGPLSATVMRSLKRRGQPPAGQPPDLAARSMGIIETGRNTKRKDIWMCKRALGHWSV